jgi:hypothetical protein
VIAELPADEVEGSFTNCGSPVMLPLVPAQLGPLISEFITTSGPRLSTGPDVASGDLPDAA